LRERGYNQAACLTKGIQQATGLPSLEHVLIRKIQSKSLVGQNRAQRYESLSDAFGVENEELIKDKHILVVDDTLTTGATFFGGRRKTQSRRGKRNFFSRTGGFKIIFYLFNPADIMAQRKPMVAVAES